MILEPLECSLTSSGIKPEHTNLPNLGRIDLSADWNAMASPNRPNGISKKNF